MKYKIATQDNTESDMFLRCLWSQLRAAFDNFAWNYWGIRKNNTIDLGMLCLGLSKPVHILYDYKRKGTIDNLYIHLDGDEQSSDIEDKIGQCVLQSKGSGELITEGRFNASIHSYFDIDDYSGKYIELVKSEYCSKLAFSVSYFDKVDLEQEFSIRASEIIKFLSLAFKTPVIFGKSNHDFIQGFTLFSKNELDTIDGFLNQSKFTSTTYNKILEAISLYNNAQKILYVNKSTRAARPLDCESDRLQFYIPECHKEILNLHQKVAIDIEIALVSLISSIEVISTLEDKGSKTCNSCGQQVYKISSRVTEFSKKFGGEYVEKNIKRAYNIRSQIVHAGVLLERQEVYQGVTNPRFDFSQSSSLLKHTDSLPELLLDDVRVVLLNYIKSLADQK